MASTATDTTGATYTDTEALFKDVLPASPSTSVLLAGASKPLIRAVTFICWRPANSPPLRLLATPEALKACRRDFSLAARMADLEADDRMYIHAVGGDELGATVTAQDGWLAVILPTQDGHAVVPGAPDEVGDAVEARLEALVRQADGFPLRTPGLSRVRQSLAAEIGGDTRDDFDAILEVVEAGESGAVSPPGMALLAAALNDVQLYHISRWGEDVGLASKATFSRTKTMLDDAEILDSEKVAIEVGRPRLRLTLHSSIDHLELPELVAAAAAAE